ncbi:hypothetical protein [Streptomyces sp. NPDC002990]
MSNASRRSLLAAVAASAAAPLTSLTVSPARAAAAPATVPTTTATTAVGASLTGPRSSMTLTGTPYDIAAATRASVGALTATVLPGTAGTAGTAGTPDRTEVTSGGQERVALLTKGARTVLLTGPERTFTENKQPFTDDFARSVPDPAIPDASRRIHGWGSAPGGGSWTLTGGAHSAQTGYDYAVTPGAGTIRLTDSAAGRYATLTDAAVADVDFHIRAGFDKVPSGEACSYAAVFGFDTVDNHYRARLSFTTQGAVDLRLESVKAGTTHQLLTTPDRVLRLATDVAAGTEWTVRVRRSGARSQVKAWPSAGTEPAAWTAEFTNTDHGSGRMGLRAYASPGCTSFPITLTVRRFAVREVTWHRPPVVTHRDWVRVLDAPFDGNWTPALEATVRGWAGSLAPDVLSYAAMFLPGAPAVSSGSRTPVGARVLGDAGYGKLDSQGLLPVGADFHDYMDRDWTLFPDKPLERKKEGLAGNLDCSGYVRMVYGYHMGVPLFCDVDPEKRGLPRRSGAMVDSAPGVRIGQTADGVHPPAAALLQPGDLVLFGVNDAEESVTDPDDYAVDHVGIYLGPDADGRRRFVSSRKSSHGPTMGDMSGASVLDGTGTYATRLHTVHRL